jgi:hypothetical protein
MRTPYQRGLAALARLRTERTSLTEAAREEGLTLEEAKEHVGRAIRKRRGRWRAKPWDRLEREMRFLDGKGLIAVTVRDSRSAQRIGRYMNAVDEFLRQGDPSVLDEFRGRSFQSFGETYDFITDPVVLKRLGKAGEAQFEQLYAMTGDQS